MPFCVIEFLDAWSEGDGDRICRCWKLHFHEGKYALQALRIQFQLVELSPHQLKWNRFVNYKGTNIPCDLHINRGIINHMGANLSESAVRRAGQSITMIEDIINNFDRCTNVRVVLEAVTKVVGVVKRNKLLDFIPVHSRSCSCPLSHLKKQHRIVNKQFARINWECVFGAENVEEDNDNDT